MLISGGHISNRSMTQIYILHIMIAVKCILVVGVQWHHDANVLFTSPAKSGTYSVPLVSIQSTNHKLHGRIIILTQPMRYKWLKPSVGSHNKLVSLPCTVAKSETFWRATGQSNSILLTQLHFSQWISLPFCLLSLIGQWFHWIFHF